ncbi:MAG: Na+/Ca+ antiporter, CaCA family [uncultured bacterium]|nr:MAG: Na+/Ca+ antiporter, CaCA family [uncultured bacterium]
MEAVAQLVILLISLAILAKSSQVVIKNLLHLGKILSWNTFVTGFLILGMASSTPEFFVGINSAIDGTPQLSLGNLIGASLVLLTFVTGITAAYTGGISLSRTFPWNEVVIMDAVMLSPLLLLLDKSFTRLDAFVLLLIWGIYAMRLYKNQTNLTPSVERLNFLLDRKLTHDLGAFTAGSIGLILASKFAVSSAVTLANIIDVPVLIIGILLLAIGTNLPELILSFTAVQEHQKNLILGDVLGSATTNTLILSVLGLIHPFEINDSEVFATSAIFLIAAVAFFSFLIKSKNRISRQEGFILLGLYCLFVTIEITTKIF